MVLTLMAIGASVVGSGAAQAAEGDFTAFGAASVVRGDRLRDQFLVLTSDVEASVPYAGVSWVPKVRRRDNFLLYELNRLSVDYRVYGGGIGLGSPRFSIGVDTNYDGVADGNIFVYIGDGPNFTAPTSPDFQSSGNLLATSDLRVDSTQIGGPYYGNFDDALDIAAFAEVVSVDFVVDSGYAFDGGVQSIVVTDLQVNRDSLKLRPLEVRTPTAQ